jgi:hypothetical protein
VLCGCRMWVQSFLVEAGPQDLELDAVMVPVSPLSVLAVVRDKKRPALAVSLHCGYVLSRSEARRTHDHPPPPERFFVVLTALAAATTTIEVLSVLLEAWYMWFWLFLLPGLQHG